MQIRTKLTLQFVLIVTLIVTLAFVIIYYSASLYNRNEFYQRLENKAKTSAEIFISEAQIDTAIVRKYDRRQKDKLPYENISIYNSNKQLVYTNNDSIFYVADNKVLNELSLIKRKEFNKNNYAILGISFKENNRDVFVFASAIDIFGSSKLKNLRNTILFLFFFIISVLAIAGWFFSGRALRPLSKVINEVENLEIDKFEKRLNKSKNNDEIGRLIDTFNILLSRIENAFNLQKLFLSGASHELKNPLTSITSQLQVVLINERSNEEYKQIISSILDDIKNLNKTTHDLIEFSRLNFENNINLEYLRIDDILWLCQDYFFKTNNNYTVNVFLENLPEESDKLVIKGNDALLKIAFINLIDNACKFSLDKTCNINLSFSENKIGVSFSDTGIGLSAEQMALIFEPFYRTNSTAEVQGHGLGLALTKKIVQLHHASISVNSRLTLGSTFFVTFNTKF